MGDDLLKTGVKTYSITVIGSRKIGRNVVEFLVLVEIGRKKFITQNRYYKKQIVRKFENKTKVI